MPVQPPAPDRATHLSTAWSELRSVALHVLADFGRIA